MADLKNFSIVPRQSSAIEKAEPGARRVLSGMVADALALAKKEQSALAALRFRIGDYEWREPDYRQILIWGKALTLKPEEVIRRLLITYEQLKDGEKEEGDTFELEPIFANGAILKMYWDFELLPLETFEWVAGLKVEVLFFVSTPEKTPNLALCLPHLRHLACQRIQLEELDLSGVPRLTSLFCDGNSLTKLDLYKVPMLTALDCNYNPLGELDLSGVPMLTELHCQSSRLTKLDISHVPMLKVLDCTNNKLTVLDVSGLALLSDLGCGGNQLTKLDLSGMPKLNELNCWENRITELDLSHVPMLKTLNCCGNKLTQLDIRSLQNLKVLYYYNKFVSESRLRLIQRSDQDF